MAFKPFRPPSIRDPGKALNVSQHESEPPSKRRKISEPTNSSGLIGGNSKQTIPKITPARLPLHPVKNVSSNDNSGTNRHDEALPNTYFSVLWRKFTQKKNKTWDDDGYISIREGIASLYDNKGKLLGQGPFSKVPEGGVIFSLAGRDIEIGEQLSRQEFKEAIGNGFRNEKEWQTDKTVKADDSSLGLAPLPAPKPKTLKEQMQLQIANEKTLNKASKKSFPPPIGQRVPFKQPLKENTVLPQIPSEKPIPRHDPDTPGSLVFKRPKRVPKGCQIVDVVLDPLLCKRLRDHQRSGIEFLYECVMDLRDFGGQGCILADDMGLGKTLQTIALLWTLLKQNPIHKAEPVVKKALIVCPVTLIQNWKKEFRKWLGRDRLGVMTLEDKGSRLSMFDGKNFKVLIIGYERLRNIAEELTRGAGIDIVICDEGHRLKTLKNKSTKAIETFNTSKRIILSGTPIQNDLSEFFAMANFVNDGCLGSYKSFVKDFETPIMKSRQPGATEDDIERGEDAGRELAQTTSPFILRRTADILAKYLPPKTEYVLFCDPTQEQAKLYQEIVKSPMFQSALGSHESALQLITILKKLCNSPALMRPDRGTDESTPSGSLTTLNEMLPAGISRLYRNSFSSKIRLLDELLQQIRNTTNDKVILVSNYTSTLNLMASLLDSSGGRYLRLDGSTPQGKRQGLVDEFNQSPASACFAFLLSAKAGGVGLNLIGANRLVLFDVDWNPATDDQAMARIHREGQKKPCKIYRFLMKGGLEERIWQRQVVKRGLADSIMDGGKRKDTGPDIGSKGKKGKAAFSREELRDLFRLDTNPGLRTHELIGCKCEGNGEGLSITATTPSALPSAEEKLETDSVSSEDIMELPDTSKITKASHLSDELMEEQERRIAAGLRHGELPSEREVEAHELMLYSHLDTASIPDLYKVDNVDEVSRVAMVVGDTCLMNVLKQDSDTVSGRIAYVFKKSTELEASVEDDIEPAVVLL